MTSRLLSVCVAVLMSAAMGSVTAAELQQEAASDIPDVGRESTTYCGIYCAYAAMNGFGKHIDFTSLLETKYVGTMYGSSIQELEKAVTDNGLHALPMMGLSRANLISATTPIVLHVSRPEAPGYFGHWVLFLGIEDGKAKILDVPHRTELVPVADVLARWDGVGLYISEKPISPWQLKVESVLTGENVAVFAGLLVLMAILQRLSTRRRNGSVVPRRTWVIAPSLLVLAGLLAVSWHFLSHDGYARNKVALRTVIQQHLPSFLPKLGVAEMQKAMQDGKVVIIDARYPRDYEAGHLPGAINVPVFTTQAERRRLLEAVPRDAKIVVYCQSDSCQFDEALGSALVAEGIENVSLFPGGWTQWDQKDSGSVKPVKEEVDE
ncbi:MAG: Rhodanese-related sulfurtransferase [Schlesneria sp.]|nr:Rhodanese-related sulfurtransferase [Schlesneria sp.]